MAGIITTGSHPKAHWPGIAKWWGVNYKNMTPTWKQIFESRTSEMSYEEEVEDVGMGLLGVKGQGSGINYDTTSQGTVSRYSHLTYALGYIVTLEELQDNLYEKVSRKRTMRLARSTFETEEIVHANVLNRAFTAAYAGGDSKELCATDHPTASGNQSNELTIAADLSEGSIEDMCIQIRNSTDSRGLRFPNKAKQLIVPNNLEFEAHRILDSVLQNDSANNAVNVLKAQKTIPGGIIVWDYLTDPDAWFIQTDCMDGLTHFTRMAATFDKDNDFDTKNAKASVIARWSQGWSDFRNVSGSPGA